MALTSIASGRLDHDPIGQTFGATLRLPPITFSVSEGAIRASSSPMDFTNLIVAACTRAVADIVIAEWRRLQAEEKAKADRCWHV